jgi:hypothetical protein
VATCRIAADAVHDYLAEDDTDKALSLAKDTFASYSSAALSAMQPEDRGMLRGLLARCVVGLAMRQQQQLLQPTHAQTYAYILLNSHSDCMIHRLCVHHHTTTCHCNFQLGCCYSAACW